MNKQPEGLVGFWKGEVLGDRRQSAIYTHLEDLLKENWDESFVGTLEKVLWDCMFEFHIMP